MGDFEASAPKISSQMTMLAIYPPPEVLQYARKFAQPDVIRNGLHMTLVRLGQVEDSDIERLKAVCSQTGAFLNPVELSVEGAGFFSAPDMFVHWLLINGAGLDIWRGVFLDHLDKAGLLPTQRYGYTPHMTLGYYPKAERLPDHFEDSGEFPTGKWLCESLYLVRGRGEKIPIPIGPQKTLFRW